MPTSGQFIACGPKKSKLAPMMPKFAIFAILSITVISGCLNALFNFKYTGSKTAYFRPKKCDFPCLAFFP